MATDSLSEPRGVDVASYLGYNGLVVPPAVAGYHLSRFTSQKVRAGVEGRRGLWRRLEAAKDRLRGAVWFHATSVGEYEQARPIIRAFKREAEARGENIPILLTVFSPSGHGFASGHPEADHLEYLPLDTIPAAWRLMRILRPRALVFVKFDCWPNMIWAARRAGVPLLLLDATLHRKSHRLRPIARGFFGRLFDCFSAIGAISEDDARRFTRGLGTRTKVSVTGDTRTDQVVHRWEEAAHGNLAKQLAEQRYRYVALGSVWPPDEAVILEPALETVGADDALGIIAVPHEPHPSHVQALEEAMRAHGLEPTRLSELIELKTRARRSTAAAKDPARWRAIVVDTVGVLAEIYRSTILSYVGGSFSTGVHNVLEPAVTGQPVLFGPRIHNAYEAERLVEQGGGFIIQTPADARRRLGELLGEEEYRSRCGEIAQRFVMDQSGATAASLALLRAALGEH